MALKMLTWPGMTSSRAAIYPSHSSPSPPPQTSPIFHLFTSLPTELRLKILSFALHDLPPRILPINPLPKTQPTNPSLLSVNSESRFETKRLYKKHQTHAVISSGSYHINYAKDTLYLNNSLGLRANATMYPSFLKPVRYLAIEFKQFACLTSVWMRGAELDLWGLLRWYTPELEELCVVVGKRRREGEIRFLEVSGEEAYMEYLDREERRQLVEGGGSFERVKEEGVWCDLRLRWVREGGEGERKRAPRIGAWGSLDLKV